MQWKSYPLLVQPTFSRFAKISWDFTDKCRNFREPFGKLEDHFQEQELQDFLEFAEYILKDQEFGASSQGTNLRECIRKTQDPDEIQIAIYAYWRSQALKYDSLRRQLAAGLRKCSQSPRIPQRLLQLQNATLRILEIRDLILTRVPKREIGETITIRILRLSPEERETIQYLPRLVRELLPIVPDEYVRYAHKRQINLQAGIMPNIIQLEALNNLYHSILRYRKPYRLYWVSQA